MTQTFNLLYVGRFQPFHFGHLQVIQDILAGKYGGTENLNLWIVIGSSEKSHSLENPLTADERIKILNETMEDEFSKKISKNDLFKNWHARVKIFKVPDIDNADLWVAHLNTFVPDYQAVVSGSPLVLECYENYNSKISKKSPENKKYIEKNSEVKEIKKINLDDYPTIHATKIREQMINDPNWGEKITKFVPKTVAKKLQQWKIDERLRKLAV